VISLNGKTALITGGSRGIGFGVAERFLEAGARLHILSETTAALEAADALGSQVTGHVCDITDGEAVAALVASLGTVDILVNNAGLERITALTDMFDPAPMVEETFRRIMDINVTGTFLLTRAVLPLIPHGGAIINTASIWGKTGPAWYSAYAASKHAVIGLTRVWARELGRRGIRVNAVCPGWVETEPAMLSLQRLSDATGRDADDLLHEIVSAQDLPGLMKPADVSGLYVFLASDLAASITGQAINADRGEVQG